MTTGHRIAIVASLLCASSSCRKQEPKVSKEAPPQPPAQQAPATPTRAAPVHERMQEQFDAIVRVRDDLIAGNIDGAKVHARTILAGESDPGIESWRAWVAEMRQAATQVADATDIGRAAAGAAELARACGQCHAAHSVSADPGALPVPALAGSDAVPHMLRHQWAAERMWEGLIGPSDTRWTVGVTELAETPLASDEILSNQSVAPRITDLADQVHALGAQAGGVPDTAWDTRSAMYGRFLSTCAGCHQAIRPPAPRS